MTAKYQLAFYGATQSNTIEPVTESHKDWGTAIKHILRITGTSFHSVKGKKGDIVQILFVKKSNLADTKFLQNLCSPESNVTPGLRRVFSPNSSPDDKYRPQPIITIGPVQIMNIYEDAPPLEFELVNAEKPGVNPNSFSWKESRKGDKWLYDLGLDHRIKFLDSGIWHRYIPYDKHFETDFPTLLQTIAGYHKNNLYRSLASLANLEFQCRMLQQSYIHKVGEQGHHEAVTPFKFHSETMTKRKIDAFITFFKEQKLDNIEWNILLVDDYADRNISTDLTAKELKSRLNVPEKWALVAEILNACNIKHRLEYTEGASQVIKKGIEFLKKDTITIDLILLDYLLGESEFMPGHKAYGHEFLLEMSQEKCNRGPLGRFWIILTSTFPFAFIDKLRQLSMDGSTERWYIANGSDPITTPELYKLGVLRVLLRQISECYLFDAALMRQIDRFDGVNEIGQWCNALINRLLQVQETRKVLEGDRERHSKFAETMEEYLDNHSRYSNFLSRLEDWLRFFSHYKKGKSAKEYYDDLEKIRTEFIDFTDMIDYVKSKSNKFVWDAQHELIKKIENRQKEINLIPESGDKKGSQQISDGFLYAFPENLPHGKQLITQLDLSNQKLKVLPKSIIQMTNLESLNLSNNPDLFYIPAEEILERNTKLREINLKNTKIGDALSGKYPVESNKSIGVKKILSYIRDNTSLFEGYSSPILSNTEQINVFISYAHADREHLLTLKKQFYPLEKGGVRFWHDERINPGTLWEDAIMEELNKAHIILLLLSPDFIASEFITNKEIPEIRRRFKKKQSIVVPIYLRYCDTSWIQSYIPTEGLPKDGNKKPILSSHYPNQDEVYFTVTEGLRKLIEYHRRK